MANTRYINGIGQHIGGGSLYSKDEPSSVADVENLLNTNLPFRVKLYPVRRDLIADNPRLQEYLRNNLVVETTNGLHRIGKYIAHVRVANLSVEETNQVIGVLDANGYNINVGGG